MATEIKSGLFNWIPELDAIGRSEGDDIIYPICEDVKLFKDIGKEKAIKSGKISASDLGSISGRRRFIYEVPMRRTLFFSNARTFFFP